jgi:hypothetical protein
MRVKKGMPMANTFNASAKSGVWKTFEAMALALKKRAIPMTMLAAAAS